MRSRSLVRQVWTTGVACIVGALLVVGIGTGVVVFLRDLRHQDRALLAAAHAYAGPSTPGTWIVEHSRSPVEVSLSSPLDPSLSRPQLALALSREAPVFFDSGHERMLLLPVEFEEDEDTSLQPLHEIEEFRIVVARAPRITVAGSIGPFALAYGGVALLIAVATAVTHRRLVRYAFRPLLVARTEASRITELRPDARLTTGGPVEVADVIDAVNGLLDRLERAFLIQSRFTAEAAHELRTPITALRGELDLALRRPRSGEEYRAALVTMLRQVERIAALVNGLTALARIDAGQLEQDQERIHAGEVARAATEAVASLLEASDCQLTLTIDDDTELLGHRELLDLALENLLRNVAIHASGSKASLTVSASAEMVRFVVDDEGPGLSADQRSAVFDRFVRSGEARRRDRNGLGLGLPLAREVARRHGGDCWLDASPAGGCRATWTVRAAFGGERP